MKIRKQRILRATSHVGEHHIQPGATRELESKTRRHAVHQIVESVARINCRARHDVTKACPDQSPTKREKTSVCTLTEEKGSAADREPLHTSSMPSLDSMPPTCCGHSLSQGVNRCQNRSKQTRKHCAYATTGCSDAICAPVL